MAIEILLRALGYTIPEFKHGDGGDENMRPGFHCLIQAPANRRRIAVDEGDAGIRVEQVVHSLSRAA